VGRRLVLGAAVAAVIAAGEPATARAYEYEVLARTLAQGYQLRGFRAGGDDVWLSRRRFTQTLSLVVWDIGELAARRRAAGRRVSDGPRISMTSYLRLDHDFGDWTLGTLRDPRFAEPIDALDAIPELASSTLALDLLYGYLAIDGLWDGAVDVRLGRQVALDPLDSWAMDGAVVRARAPGPVAFEVGAGLRVRDASPAGAAVFELDGTAGADCREYVEGAAPGEGTWQIIDRSRVPGDATLGADLDFCPQREVMMPTVGLAVETDGLRRVHARLAYRRSMSPTVGVIGEVDRLDTPDLGLYPDEVGQAPAWGVDEEHVSASAAGRLRGGGIEARPWAGARLSLLHGVVDDAMVGVELRRGAHAVTPEVSRHVPTFDGDSVWNVFAVEPSTDLRLGWRWGRGGWRTHATTWARRYEPDEAAWAGGVAAGVERRTARVAVRADAVADDGWGGRRLGGSVTARWQRSRGSLWRARAGAVDVRLPDDPTSRAALDATHATLELGGTWAVVDGVGLHVLAEGTASRLAPGQLRALVVVDLAFVPEI
jgi:hypothetical protein